MSKAKTKVITRRAWTDREHDFLRDCAKATVPFDWVDRALGRSPRTSASHAKATGIKPSVWNGRISYQKGRQLRGKFAILCSKHKKRGLKLKRIAV